CRHYNNLPYTF
nr:immunoglobulin light chain junction region [Macaca mulatta]